MATDATLAMTLTVIETLTGSSANFAAAAKRRVTNDSKNVSKTFSATSSPAATKVAVHRATITTSATIDLTSLNGNDGTVTGNGLKLQSVLIQAKSDNTNPITVTEGAVNGYAMLGASFLMILQAGQSVLIDFNNASPSVAAGDKTLDVSCTGTQILDIVALFG